MLNSEQKKKISNLVEVSLDRAESIWSVVDGDITLAESISTEAMVFDSALTVSSMIPSHPLVNENNPIIDEFIACVVDMRESSKHLLCSLSKKTAKVSELKRVYYETSALLPAIAQTIEFSNGKVTEYLGDGVLALFQVPATEGRADAIYSAHNAAKNCLSDTRQIINDALSMRYNLPPINIGAGMAFSKAIVSLVGLGEDKQAKVIGSCVYYAAKLSGGVNEIYADEKLKSIWPKSKGGTLVFKQKNIKGVSGYLLAKEN
ncbi:hypothetical protein V3O24_01365 [Methylobacter sp. Wu8]|uniref:hypothetical protein n=1 Tax=Methylobacter sp. Wu8 TaxID=3118457 RepID=UPI002F2FFD5E